MKKQIENAESDSVRDKQHRERVADDVVDRQSNKFPNFMALTKKEKLAFFESLHAARKNVLERGNKVAERFGTVHDEYLKYFGSVEDRGGSESFKDSPQTPECSGASNSVSSSLRSEFWRTAHSSMSTNSFIHDSIMSSKSSLEKKFLTSKEDEGRDESGSGNKSTQSNQTRTKSPKRKRLHDDDSDKVKAKTSSRFVTKLPKLKKRDWKKGQKDERKCEMFTSNESRFEALESDEKEIFTSTLKEATDKKASSTESSDKDNEILSTKDIRKKQKKPKEGTSMQMKVPYRKETVIITSPESKKIKKERVLKRRERCRRPEKERANKATGVNTEKDKKCKAAERKLIRSADGVRKKQQGQNNWTVMARKPKENVKKEDSIRRFEKACQNKRNREERRVLVKSESSVMKSRGGKQDKNKILASRKKTQKDKAKERRQKSKKEGSPKSEHLEQDRQFVLVEEEKEEVAEEVKEDSKSSRECLGRPTETESIGTFFVDKSKNTDEAEDEGEDKTENDQPEDSLSLKCFQSEFGEEVKCLEVDSVGDNGATLSIGTTDEDITIEVGEEVPMMETPSPAQSEVKYQPEQTEADFKQKSHTEESKILILELKLEGEGQDDCYAGKSSSHLVTSGDESVLQLWEELKLLQLSDSDSVMETESKTAQLRSENISESWFTFLSNKISPNKVCFAEENLIGSENEIQDDEGRREAGALDVLESEGVIVVDGDAIKKIKNLVEALEKEAEPEGDTKLEAKPDKNLENEYNQLLFEYTDYFTRLLYMLTNKREQKPKTRVRASLTAARSHPEFVDNKSKKLEFMEKPRAVSDTDLLEDKKTEVEVEARESTLQESEVEADPSSLLLISDSPTTESSCEDDVPSVTTPSTRKKLIEDFVRERAKFVEESIDGFRFIKMASEVQGQETGQKTKFKFFHLFSRFCKCVKKKGSEEDQVQRRRQQTGGK